MTKYGRQKQRDAKRAAADTHVVPEKRWSPPPEEECHVRDPPLHYALSETSRITHRQLRDDRGVVDYAVVHEVREPDGSWHEVIRVDCAHGEVHVHRFIGRNETREVIRPILSQSDVTQTMQGAYDLVFELWQENERQWRRG